MIEKQHILFRSETIGKFLFFVKDGGFEVIYSTGLKKKIMSGELFGEIALLQDSMRHCTAIATESSTLLCLDGKAFRKILYDTNSMEVKEKLFYLSCVPLFSLYVI